MITGKNVCSVSAEVPRNDRGRHLVRAAFSRRVRAWAARSAPRKTATGSCACRSATYPLDTLSPAALSAVRIGTSSLLIWWHGSARTIDRLVALVPRLRCKMARCRQPPDTVRLRTRFPAQAGGGGLIDLVLKVPGWFQRPCGAGDNALLGERGGRPV
jgi:hypothetical protein